MVISDKKYKILLASASPRRSELMQAAGFDFEVFVTNADEEPPEVPDIKEGKAIYYAQYACHEKTRAALSSYSFPKDIPTYIITCDTIVSADPLHNEAFGKPKDDEDAYNMLRAISGKEHWVISAYEVTEVRCGNPADARSVPGYKKTTVRMKDLSDDEIRLYISSGEPEGKAGAYAIQSRASVFIKEIVGDYANVVGLPINEIYEVFTDRFGFNPIYPA